MTNRMYLYFHRNCVNFTQILKTHLDAGVLKKSIKENEGTILTLGGEASKASKSMQ